MVLDGNHIAYRAYYKFKNLKTVDGLNTAIVFGVPRIIENLIRTSKYPDRVIATFDGGRSKNRMAIHPEYKKRDQKLGFDREDFIRQKTEVMYTLGHLGLEVAFKGDMEADDIIAMIVRRNKNYHKTIVSGDKDFNQLVDDTTVVYNSNKRMVLTKDNMKEHTGYHPHQCVDFLSLWGDSSDNIPGYPGIGEKRAAKLLEKFGSIKGFLASDDSFGKTDKNKLKELHKLNKKLIDLRYYYRKHLMHEKIPYLDIPNNMEQFEMACKINETNSFLKPQFINTFKYLQK